MGPQNVVQIIANFVAHSYMIHMLGIKTYSMEGPYLRRGGV